MSCYHSMLGVPVSKNENGKWTYKIAGLWDPIASQLDPRCIKIPCGRCIGCRLDYSRAWADRMMLELDHTGKGIFITLTYNDENIPMVYDDTDVPVHCTLKKRDLQLFMKRVRRAFPERQLRFYACGEYGSESERCHYHIILFGLAIDELHDLIYRGKSKLGFPLWSSETIGKHWYNEDTKESLGFNRVAEVTWKTCAYVARYVNKKVFHGVNVFLADEDIEPEFSLMSRRPGIGALFLDDHGDIFDQNTIFVSGKPEGVNLPKYFLKKLSLIDPERYDIICRDRKEFANDALMLKMQQTDLFYPDLMALEERTKLSKAGTLKRSCI